MKFKRIIFIIIGAISLSLGIIGIFLPLLPTTPFLLLALFLYSKSSKKLYRKVLTNRYTGKYVRDYITKRGIALNIKLFTIILLWLSICFSILFVVNLMWVKILLTLVACGVTIHVLSFKTLR